MLKRKRTRENIGLKMHFYYGVRLLSPWGKFPGLPSHSRTCTRTCTHLLALCASTMLCACVLFCYSTSSWVLLLGWAEDGAGLLAVMKTLCRNSDGLWEASPREPGDREWCQGWLHPALHRGLVAESTAQGLQPPPPRGSPQVLCC